MDCPTCGRALEARSRHGVAFSQCPGCGGVWLSRDAIAALAIAVPAPGVAAERPTSTRLEDRAPGAGAGRGTRFGGAHSRGPRPAPKTLIETIFADERD